MGQQASISKELEGTEEGDILKEAYGQVRNFSTLISDSEKYNELKGLFENLEKLRKKEKNHPELDKSKIPWYQEFKHLLEKVRFEVMNTRQGHRPLHRACLYGNHKAVELLLKENEKWTEFQVDVNATDPYGKTALYFAAEYYNVECICVLCNAACEKLDLFTRGEDGRTPLQMLARLDNEKPKEEHQLETMSARQKNAEAEKRERLEQAQLGKLVIKMCEVYQAVHRKKSQEDVVVMLNKISEDLIRVQSYGKAEECDHGQKCEKNGEKRKSRIQGLYETVCMAVNSLKMKALNKIFYHDKYHFDTLCGLVSTGLSCKHHGSLIREAKVDGTYKSHTRSGGGKRKGWLPCTDMVHSMTEEENVITQRQRYYAAALLICYAAVPKQGVNSQDVLRDLLQVDRESPEDDGSPEASSTPISVQAEASLPTADPSAKALFECPDCYSQYQRLVKQLSSAPGHLMKKAIQTSFQNAQVSALRGIENNTWPTELLWCLAETNQATTTEGQHLLIDWKQLHLRADEPVFSGFDTALERSVPRGFEDKILKANLSKNPRIGKVPLVVMRMKHLQELDLSHCKKLDTKSTAQIFKGFQYLEVLNLSDCGLTQLVEEKQPGDDKEELPGYLPLKELYLAGNKLDTLPDTLENYPLEKLDLRRNEFREVPKWISKVDLTVLLLDGNGKIETLPTELGRILKVGVEFSTEGCKPLSKLLGEEGISNDLTPAEIGKRLQQKLIFNQKGKIPKLVILGHSTLHDEFCNDLSASAHLKLPYNNILCVGDLAMYGHFGSLLDDGNSHYLLVWDRADHSSKYNKEEYLKLVQKHSPKISEGCPYKKCGGHVAIVNLHNGPESSLEKSNEKKGILEITLEHAWREQRGGLQKALRQISDWAKKCTCKIEAQALHAEFSEHLHGKLKQKPVLTMEQFMTTIRDFSHKRSRVSQNDGTASDWNIAEFIKDLHCRGTAIQLGMDTDLIMSASWLLQELTKSDICRTRQSTPQGEDHCIPALVANVHFKDETQSSVELTVNPNLALLDAAAQIGLAYPFHPSSEVSERFCPLMQGADVPAGFWDALKKEDIIHRVCVLCNLNDLPNLIAFYHRFQAHLLADLTSMLQLPATMEADRQSSDGDLSGQLASLAERIRIHGFQLHTWQRGFFVTHKEDFFCSSLLIDTATPSNAHNFWPASCGIPQDGSNRKAGLLLSVRRNSTLDKAAVSSLSGMVDVAVQLVLDTDKVIKSYVEQYVICSQCVAENKDHPGSIHAVNLFDTAHEVHDKPFEHCKHKLVGSVESYLPDFFLQDMKQGAGAVRLLRCTDFINKTQGNAKESGACFLQESGEEVECYRKVYKKKNYGQDGHILRANVISALRQELVIYRVLQENVQAPGSAFLVECLGAYSESSSQLGLALEFGGAKTLSKVLDEGGAQWSCLLRNQMAAQLSCGLAYLHRCGIIHRDVKADNIMIPQGRDSDLGNGRPLVKIIDVDASFRVSASHPKHCEDVKTNDHRAPEVHSLLKYPGQYGPQADVFSLGRIFASLITMKAIGKEIIRAARERPGGLEPLAIALKQTEEQVPSQRPSAAGLASYLTFIGANLLMKSLHVHAHKDAKQVSKSLAVVPVGKKTFLFASLQNQRSGADKVHSTEDLWMYDCSAELQGTMNATSKEITAPEKNSQREILCLAAGPDGTLFIAMRCHQMSRQSTGGMQDGAKIVVRLYTVVEATGELKASKQDDVTFPKEVTTMYVSDKTLLVGTADGKIVKLVIGAHWQDSPDKESTYPLHPGFDTKMSVIQLVPFSQTCIWWLVCEKAKSGGKDITLVGMRELNTEKDVAFVTFTSTKKEVDIKDIDILQLAKVSDNGKDSLWACSQHHLLCINTQQPIAANKYEYTDHSLESCLPEDIQNSRMSITSMCSARETLWLATNEGSILVFKPSDPPQFIVSVQGHQAGCLGLWSITSPNWHEDKDRVISIGGSLKLKLKESLPTRHNKMATQPKDVGCSVDDPPNRSMLSRQLSDSVQPNEPSLIHRTLSTSSANTSYPRQDADLYDLGMWRVPEQPHEIFAMLKSLSRNAV